MRSRIPFIALLLVIGSFAVPHLAHAAIPFFGPIIPQEGGQAVCAGGWGMFVNVINRLIELLITLAIVFVAPIMIAWSGFLMVVNPFNAGAKEKAKSILTNTIVGIVIALAAWLIVDAVMVVLYNPSASSGGTSLTAWTDLISKNGVTCIPLAGSLSQTAQTTTTSTPSVSTTPASGTGTGKFTFNPGIDAQVASESSALSSLLSCMSSQLTSNAIITSISDSAIVSGKATMAQCRSTQGKSLGCAHTANSCHYGGRSCGDSSYAVDLVGDYAMLTTVAKSCGASTLNEGNHLHVSVGAQNGCGCDASLD